MHLHGLVNMVTVGYSLFLSRGEHTLIVWILYLYNNMSYCCTSSFIILL